MADQSTQNVTLSNAAQTTMRMLIASYFVAASVGSVPGADTGLLFSALFPAPVDDFVGSSLVFILACMVMIGTQTRVAALLLGMMTFYASYLHLVQIGAQNVLGTFWRDMALIAALMLTYGCDRFSTRGGMREEVEPRRMARTSGPAAQAGAALAPIPQRRKSVFGGLAPGHEPEMLNIFAEEEGERGPT